MCCLSRANKCLETEKEKIEFIKNELEQSYIDYSSTHDEKEIEVIHEVFRFWLEHHQAN